MSTSPWGPLGSPSKEQIQKWVNLPYGEFTKIMKEKSKKKKGKVQTEHTVYITKNVAKQYITEMKVMAFDSLHALTLAQIADKTELQYSEEPFRTNVITYTFNTYNPAPKKA